MLLARDSGSKFIREFLKPRSPTGADVAQPYPFIPLISRAVFFPRAYNNSRSLSFTPMEVKH